MTRQKTHTMGAGTAAGICLVAVVLLYHIPLGDTLGADALHALGAAVVALVCSRLSRASAGVGRTRHGGMGVTMAIAGLCLLAALAVTLASAAGSEASLPVETANLDAALAAVPLVALSCLATAVWEETFFRKLAHDAVGETLGSGKLRDLRATCACAAVFALMHMGQAADLAQEALRFVQVFLFGLAMSGLRAHTGRLGWSIGVHAAYDLVCFLPAALTWQAGVIWEMPATALATVEVGMPGILASLVVLVPAAALAIRELARS